MKESILTVLTLLIPLSIACFVIEKKEAAAILCLVGVFAALERINTELKKWN